MPLRVLATVLFVLTALSTSATATPPPPPPPPELAFKAARLLWTEHPPTSREREEAFSTALEIRTRQALDDVGIGLGPDDRDNKRFHRYSDRLKSMIKQNLPPLATIADELDRCVIDEIARQMSPEEIDSLRRFTATTSGEKFWVLSRYRVTRLTGCYTSSWTFGIVRDADYRAVGLKPPRRQAPQPIM